MKTVLLISDLECELKLIEGGAAAVPELLVSCSNFPRSAIASNVSGVDLRSIYERMGESVPRVIRVLAFFCEGSRELLELCTEVASSSEVAALARLAHSIKSLFQEVGAEAYARLAAEAESLARQGRGAEAYKMLAGLPEGMRYTTRIVEQLLERVDDKTLGCLRETRGDGRS